MALERHMKCGVGECGHCYVNHRYVCTDGPVFSLAELRAAARRADRVGPGGLTAGPPLSRRGERSGDGELVNQRVELLVVDRLGERGEKRASRRQRLDGVRPVRGHQDDRHIRARGVKPVGECHPVLAGHLVVRDEQRDTLEPTVLGDLAGKGIGEHLVTVVAQHSGEPEAKGRVIVDEQDRDVAACRVSGQGFSTWKAAPPPAPCARSMPPPWAWTISLTMASPSPVPSGFVVSNRLKGLRCAGKPGPVSATMNRTFSRVGKSTDRMISPGPRPIASSAFFNRLSKTRRSLSASAMMDGIGEADEAAEGDAAVLRLGPPRRQGLFQEVGQIHRAQVQPLLAREALEVADHHVEPARRLGQLLDDVPDAAERLARVSLQATCDALREHREPGQRVADVVHDPRRECADVGKPLALATERLGLPQLLLDLLATHEFADLLAEDVEEVQQRASPAPGVPS